MAELIDKEISNFINIALNKAKEIIKNKKNKLEKVVKLLLKKETLEQKEFEEISGPKVKK